MSARFPLTAKYLGGRLSVCLKFLEKTRQLALNSAQPGSEATMKKSEKFRLSMMARTEAGMKSLMDQEGNIRMSKVSPWLHGAVAFANHNLTPQDYLNALARVY